MKKVIQQFRFALHFNRGNILFAALLLASIFLLVYNTQQSVTTPPIAAESFWWQGGNWWTQWLDPIIGMFTFLAALGVWWTHNLKYWEDQLPKRLTIHYQFGEEEIMRCEEVYLSGEGDIRPWAQQLGSQMSGNRYLLFEPFLEETAPQVKYDEVERCYYKLYTVTFYLTKYPDHRELPHHELEQFQYLQQRKEGKVVIWSKGHNKR
ncbi:MAG: hypothetical protein AAF985_14220 [Bacteroidota bacterium]